MQGAPTLLWVNNTEATCSAWADRRFLFLVAGRWFKARPRRTVDVRHADAAGGVQADPGRAPRSRVLASVPGTRQATEAVLLAPIPRTARVNKKELKAPESSTRASRSSSRLSSQASQQAVNTDKDIVKFGDLYYMCFQGVWFMSKAAEALGSGVDVPKEIYTIPGELARPITSPTSPSQDDDDNDEWVTFAYVRVHGPDDRVGLRGVGQRLVLPAVRRLRRLLPVSTIRTDLRMGAWYNPTGRIRTRLRRIRTVRRRGHGRVVQPADGHIRARRRGISVRTARAPPGRRTTRAPAPTRRPGRGRRLRQLGHQLRAARRQLGADGTQQELSDRSHEQRDSDE